MLAEARDGAMHIRGPFLESIEAAAASGRRVFGTGMGKSGVVSQRMCVSLASTGIPAQHVHGAEWAHGDLGSLQA